MNIEDIPRLTSDRLLLRAHTEHDLDPAAAMWSHPDVVRNIGGRAFTRQEVWHRILRYLGHWTLRPFGYWAIEDRSTGKFIGEIGLADWKRDSVQLDLPESGWALSPEHHGRGLAKEAIGLMLDWADREGLGSTCCIITEQNAASIALARKFGYTSTREEGGVGVYERAPDTLRDFS